MMDKIGIRLEVAESTIHRVTITPRKSTGAASFLQGMDATDVPPRIGGIFSLCAQAQTIAALTAIETALGIPARPGVSAARDALRMAEMLTQVAMRLSLYWPHALGLQADPSPARAALSAQAELEQALFGPIRWRQPGAGLAHVDLDKARKIVARLVEDAHRLTATTDLPDRIAHAGLMGFGALPDGTAVEGGTFSRRWAAPSVTRLRQAHGPGLAARLDASLVELAALPGEIIGALDRVAPSPAAKPAHLTGQGNAIVETVRGPLAHHVTLRDGFIETYRIEAPTEQNFRHGGPVAAGLSGARAMDLAQATALHIVAIDPCVEFDLEHTDA